MNFVAKKIAVLGFGIEGLAAANFFGKNNSIYIFDDKKKEELDNGFFKKLLFKNTSFFLDGKIPHNVEFDYIICSPSIRPDDPKIDKLKTAKTTITTSTKIFFDLCPAKIIGITGTKGKGTTSTLTYQILKSAKKQAYVAGNIGVPMLEILPKLGKNDWVILELSSFQLLDLKKSPHIAVVLMITSEHLDWHKDSNEYVNAKKSITRFQNKNDFAIINSDFEASRKLVSNAKSKIFFFSTQQETNGIYVKNGSIYSKINGSEKICDVAVIKLPGFHNVQNVCAAIAVSKILNIPNKNIVSVIKTFKGLKHRLQIVKNLHGVIYVNDSISTTPETTIAAIESFNQPKILILGGSSKKSDFSALAVKISKTKNIKAIILTGTEAPVIKKALDGVNLAGTKLIEGLLGMEEIVQQAQNMAKTGDVILLSPGCASFGMFKNYQDRGEQFVKEVNNLK